MVRALGQDSLQQAVRDAGIDVPAAWFDEIGSTNAEARGLAQAGAPEWTVVAAGHQSAGRGRLDRAWGDVAGEALLMSIVLRPHVAPRHAPVLTLAAALGMADAVALPGLRSKWPNDLVVEDRKLGGILAEAHLDRGAVRHVVLGIGVNVSSAPEAFFSNATSIAAEGGEAEIGPLVTRFLGAFRRRYESDRFPGDVPAAYSAICSTIGRSVTAAMAGGGHVSGLASGIADDGGLVIVAPDGERITITSGEVTHLR